MHNISRRINSIQRSAPVRTIMWMVAIVVIGYMIARAVLTMDIYYLIMAAVAALSVMVFLRRPDYALFGYALMAPYIFGGSPELEGERAGAYGATVTISVLPSQAGLILIAVLLGFRWLFIGRDIRLPEMTKPLAAFIGVAALSVAFSYVIWDPDIPLSERRLPHQIAEVMLYALCVVAFLVAVNSFDRREWVGKMIWPVTLSALYVAGFEALYPDGAISISRAHFLVSFAQIMVLAKLLYGNLRPSAIFGWTLVSLVLLWANFHDLTWVTGWMSASVGMLVLIFLRSYKVGIALCLVALFMLFIYPGAYFVVYEESAEEGSLDRFDMWIDAVDMAVSTNPILGVGVGSYMPYSRKFGSVWYGDYTYTNPHSNYAQVIAEMGILGLIVLFWVIVAGIRTGIEAVKRSAPEHRWFAIGATAVFVSFVFISTLGDYLFPSRINGGMVSFGTSVQPWIILGAAVAASGLSRKDEEEEQESEVEWNLVSR